MTAGALPGTGAPEPRAERGRDLHCTNEIRAYQKRWFHQVRERIDSGEHLILTAAVAPHEIFEAMDLPYVASEWWSGLVASKRQSAAHLDLLRSRGYHDGLPRYSAIALATALGAGTPEALWGGLPRPSLVVDRMEPGVGTRAEAVATAFDCPIYPLSVPTLQHQVGRWYESSKWEWEQLYGGERINAIVEDYRSLIATCERLSGRKFEVDRLREVMDRVNEQQQYFDKIRQMIRDAPRVPASLPEIIGNVMTIQWHRGSPWALSAARTFHDEMAQRVAAGVGVCPDERLRLSWGGVGLWKDTAFYRNFERSHGAVFVQSMYLSIAVDGYIRYGTRDPLRALASRYAAMSAELRAPGMVSTWLVAEARAHRVDAAILGRSSSPGQSGSTPGSTVTVNAFAEAGIPTLVLDMDPVDGRSADANRAADEVAAFLDKLVARS